MKADQGLCLIIFLPLVRLRGFMFFRIASHKLKVKNNQHTFKIFVVIFSLILSGACHFSLFTLNFLSGSPVFAATEINTRAINYLKSNSPSPWTTLALSAAGESSLSGEHLKGVPGTTALSYTAPIMAIAALGEDPRTFPNENFVTKLKSFHTDGQLGDPATLNDDLFGILALRAAGESANDPAIVDAAQTVLSAQNANGGWGFAVGASPDTNMTAMAIMALLESGSTPSSDHITRALSFLRDAQNEDGGFPYDPVSPFGTDSDASSDAWVISALNQLGIDPISWETASGKNPIAHLVSLQDTTAGYFRYQSNSPEDSFSPITTSYAVIALSGKGYPISFFQTSSDLPVVSFQIDGSSTTLCTGSVSAATALAVVEHAASQCGYDYTIEQTGFGRYLSRIAADTAAGLSGWRYRVNGALPSVGAADYALVSGYFVHWYFGESDDPRDFGAAIDLHARVITSGSGSGSSGNTVSLTVEPDALDFGDLHRGDSSAKTLTLTNTGSTDITIEALVTGDDLFTRNLKLNNSTWESYEKDMERQEAASVQASLIVPSNANAGNASGRLIFWAIAQ